MPGVGGIHIGLGGGGGAGTPVPLTISGLVAWYDAAKGITKDGSNRVSAWANQVTGDTNTNLAQATAGNQPLFNASDANLNGLPSLTFVNTRPDHLDSGTWSTAMPATPTWVVIGYVASYVNTLPIAIDGIGASNRHYVALNPGSNYAQMYSGTGAVPSGVISAPPVKVVLVAEPNSSGAKMWANARTAGTPGNTGTQTLTGLKVGCHQADLTDYAWNGKIAEVLGYNVPLSQANVEAILAWAGNKYGITIGA